MSRRLPFASLALAVVATAALAPSVASAAPTSFDSPSGSQSTFTYSNGQSANGAFGSPVVNDGGFAFAPSGLVATSSGSGSASDTVSIILNAKPNTVFTRIAANVRGDYTIFGTGAVNTSATFRIFNLDAPASSPIVSPLVFSPTFPQGAIANANNGEFVGATLAAADVLPAGWRNVRVELDDALLAEATFGSSLIQTKGANIDVETAAIPLPAAAAVAPILGVLAWKARRRFAR